LRATVASISSAYSPLGLVISDLTSCSTMASIFGFEITCFHAENPAVRPRFTLKRL